MLTARIHMRLDDDFAEISDALLGILYPHYPRADPVARRSCSCTPTPTRRNASGGLAVDATRCSSRKPVGGRALPLPHRLPGRRSGRSRSASARARHAPTRAAAQHGAGRACAPRCASACATLGGQLVRELGIDAPALLPRRAAGAAHRALRALRCAIRAGLVVRGGRGAPARAPARERSAPVGFGRDEGLLEYPDESFLGYRLLQEYFAFPDKFLFVELAGLEQGDATRARRESLDVSVLLRESLAELDLRVSAENLRLGCTPDREPVRDERSTRSGSRTPRSSIRSFPTCAARARSRCTRSAARVSVRARHGKADPLRADLHRPPRRAGRRGGAYWYAARRARAAQGRLRHRPLHLARRRESGTR